MKFAEHKKYNWRIYQDSRGRWLWRRTSAEGDWATYSPKPFESKELCLANAARQEGWYEGEHSELYRDEE